LNVREFRLINEPFVSFAYPMVCGPPDHQDLVSHLKMKICFAPLHVVEIAAPSAVALTNLLQQTVQVNQHF